MYIFRFVLFSIFSIVTYANNYQVCVAPDNGCVTFTIGQGTGCDWMCNYCANQLGTNNYYFKDGVCTYEQGGCVGSPVSGSSYTCCSV